MGQTFGFGPRPGELRKYYSTVRPVGADYATHTHTQTQTQTLTQRHTHTHTHTHIHTLKFKACGSPYGMSEKEAQLESLTGLRWVVDALKGNIICPPGD